MRFISFIFLLCITNISIAQSTDVISLKNGSIIRGQIVNYEFNGTKFSIKLEDGSIHTFSKSLISKISKDSNKTNASNKVINQKSVKPLPSIQLPTVEHDLSIGNLWHSVSSPYTSSNNDNLTQIARYNGVKFHYQKNYREHFALRYGLEYATLNRIEFTKDDDIVYTLYDVDRNIYTGLIISVIASTNLQRGLRAYAGAGLYNHHYFNENSKNRHYLGPRFELGGGYMWKTFSLTLQYNWHSRGQYPSNTDSIFSGGFNFSMGF